MTEVLLEARLARVVTELCLRGDDMVNSIWTAHATERWRDVLTLQVYQRLSRPWSPDRCQGWVQRASCLKAPASRYCINECCRASQAGLGYFDGRESNGEVDSQAHIFIVYGPRSEWMCQPWVCTATFCTYRRACLTLRSSS